MRQNELYHHGIKGQRWGIRRYQNPDGSLTEEGMARYREIYKEQRKLGKRDEWKDSVENNLKQKGVSHVNDKLDVIKKGSVIKRVADKNEPIGDRVKYASILDNDANNYIDTAKDGGLTMTKDTCQKEYKLNKNIKVAPASLVREYVMKSYGNSQLKEYKDYVAKMFGEQAANEMVRRYGNIPLSKVYDPVYGDDVFNAIQYNEYSITGLGKSNYTRTCCCRTSDWKKGSQKPCI